MEFNMKAIGARIKGLREKNGYTIEEIETYLNNAGFSVTVDDIKAIENGGTFTLGIANQLCNLYNCSHEFLLCKDDRYFGVFIEHTPGIDDATLIAQVHKTIYDIQILRMKCGRKIH